MNNFKDQKYIPTDPPDAGWLNLIGEAFLSAFGGAFGWVNTGSRENHVENEFERDNLTHRLTAADERNGRKH